MRKFSLLFLVFLYCIASFAQEDTTESSPVTFEAQIVSRYIWRGMNIGEHNPFVHPCAELFLEHKNHSLTLGIWGAYSLGDKFDEELDFYLVYSFQEMIELTVTDYFIYDGSSAGYDLFNWTDGETPHLLEAGLGFAGTDNIPFTLNVFMMLYGADARKILDDGTEGEIMYSKYMELGWEKEFPDAVLTLFAGASLDNPDEGRGEESFYGNTKAGIINLGCGIEKEILITPQYSSTFNAQFIINPSDESAFLVFGITF